MTSTNLEKAYVTHQLDDGGTATITFFHPAHNSLPSGLLSRLSEAIAEAGADERTRVIIIKSGGDRTFCAGASFDELVGIESEEEGFRFFSGFAHVINACRTSSKIILGRVQGKAVGGGVGVVAACDYCFATKYASVRLSELAIGIGPFVVGPAIERKIGLPAFTHLALRPGAFESAHWAKENGLYHQVFEDADSMDEAILDTARVLSGYNPDALSEIKRSLWRGTEDWETLLSERAKTSGRLILSDFAQNAIKAFKKKSG